MYGLSANMQEGGSCREMAVLDTRLLVEVQFDCNIAPRILPYSRKLELFFSFQILMSVWQTTITVMSMLSV